MSHSRGRSSRMEASLEANEPETKGGAALDDLGSVLGRDRGCAHRFVVTEPSGSQGRHEGRGCGEMSHGTPCLGETAVPWTEMSRGWSKRALVILLAAGCGGARGSPPGEPTGGTWKPILLPSAAAIRLPAPPAAGSEQERGEVQELLALAAS